MGVIDDIMQHETSAWINRQINKLPDQAKFRASNAIRFLNWANNIYEANMPIPACYCALHATEEAVAAFISCAKLYGYEDAKKINIKNHAAKATISFLGSQVAPILRQGQVGFTHMSDYDILAVRYSVDGQTYYNEASFKLFHFLNDQDKPRPDFYSVLVSQLGNEDQLKAEFNKGGHKARIGIFYADSKGYSAGFDKPEDSLSRECQLSLGLIWASLDLKKNRGELIPFYEQALRTATILIAEMEKSKQ